MQRLSGLDAAFLALETPTAHMQVLGVAVLDPGEIPARSFAERVRSLMEARLHLVPPFRRRLVEVPFGLHVPVWIDDPDFDLDYHLRRAALPSPGGPRELSAFVADVASRPLDRRHPLWEAYVVEGLERGHVAYVAKLHHSMIDGASGVEILGALFDLEPTAEFEPLTPPGDWQPERVPGETEMLGRAVVAIAQRPAKVAHAVTNLVPGLMRAVRRAREEALEVALPLTAPRLGMNRTITAHRAVALSSVSLADVKAVKNALGVTINDVVLAVATGTLRGYLARRDELPDRPLVASIPTSVRAENDRELGNRVSSMFAALPVEISDPIECVHAVARSMAGAKHVHEEVGGTTLQDWAEVAAPALFSRAMRFYTRLHVAERLRPVINLIVSNVPGPPFPLYFAGARLVAMHPLGPIFDDCGLNLTVMSYLDHVDFGFIACPELVPDLEQLAAMVPDALAELRKAAGV
ncbi:MAG TPA: wax ester/triacylglycerol synthase family O-acyltransferase [Acidimicrobiia bacterium]|nr:wax ester/triacylglycerol synthase family O-acyltransferase [Acidimicrobiia bacterium]